MPFTIMPALDVSRGRLAAWSEEGPRPVDAYGGDPIAAARALVDERIRWLHVVDMDLAFEGQIRNAETLRAIAAEAGDVRIQASGGVRSLDEARELLDAGASRVVLGSAALADEVSADELLGHLGERAIVGIEVDDGRIRSRGANRVDLDLMATLGWLTSRGAAAFLVTAVGRVGAAAGPDVELVGRVARTGRPTLVAGGVGSLEHLRSVRESGAVGAVVGRAALDGSLDLRAALAWAEA